MNVPMSSIVQAYSWVIQNRAFSLVCEWLHGPNTIQATLNEPHMHLRASNPHSLSNPCEWTTAVINVLIFTDKELTLATG